MSKSKSSSSSSKSVTDEVKLSFDAGYTLKFYGKPKRLKGNLTITNDSDNDFSASELTFDNPKKMIELGFPSKLVVSISLKPLETKTFKVKINLPKSVAQGAYKTKLIIGDKKMDTVINVESVFNLDLHPREFITQGVAPKKEYKFVMEMTNKGNEDYIVPKLGHGIILETQYMCKGRNWSLKNRAQDGEQAYQDGIAERVGTKLTDWVKLSIKETGETVKVGECVTLNLTMTLSEKIDSNSGYKGDILIGQEIIRYELLA